MPTYEVEIKLTSSIGEFNFNNYDMPLISRSVAYNKRIDSQPVARRRINVTLNGFFTGDSHGDICEKYIELKNILSADKAEWFYRAPKLDSNGAFSEWIEIADGPVYITGLNEPEDWKEYDGIYSISFYYFEKITPDNPFEVTFVNDVGTITFNPIPPWVHKIKKNRKIPGSGLSPSGASIGSEGSISLNGHIVDSNLSLNSGPADSDQSALWTSINTMQNILMASKEDATGTLNYGPFSKAVYIESFELAEGVLQNSIDYSISMKYFTEDIISLSVKRSFSRIHQNPRIIERPACGDRLIKYGNMSGQDVSYSIKIESTSISVARTLVATEFATLLVAGGIEMPGGRETWDDDNNSVSLNVNRFYNSPILGNL